MACLRCIEILEFAQLNAKAAVGLSIIRLDLGRAAQALYGIVMALRFSFIDHRDCGINRGNWLGVVNLCGRQDEDGAALRLRRPLSSQWAPQQNCEET